MAQGERTAAGEHCSPAAGMGSCSSNQCLLFECSQAAQTTAGRASSLDLVLKITDPQKRVEQRAEAFNCLYYSSWNHKGCFGNFIV